MPKFHINDMISKLPDPLRSYQWKCFIPDIDKVTNGIITSEDFVLRCRNVVIPSRGNEPIETFFMGMKAMYPGKPIYTNTFILTLEEFEDIKSIKAMNQWQENIYGTDPKSPNAGTAAFATKAKYSTDVLLRLYKQVGDLEQIEKRIRIKNAWPSNMDDVSLTYDAQETVKPTITLTFDYWILEDNKD